MIEIIDEAKKLTIEERMRVIEDLIESIQLESDKFDNLELAALVLESDYRKDKELTVFTELDSEEFYEEG